MNGVTIFAEGLSGPETPRLWPDDRSWLLVEMGPPRHGVTHISRDGSTLSLVARTGLPQGLAPDLDGNIWTLNNDPVASIMRVRRDGEAEVIADTVEGRPMLLTNDLCFGPDGCLYVTDSGMTLADWVVDGAVRPDHLTAAFDGRVYRFDPKTYEVRVIDDGLRFTNGIAFGPDGHLYVNEMITGDVFRYRVEGGSVLPGRERFANVMSDDRSGSFRGPDGMGFGADGNLYCTVFGEGNIAVIDEAGHVVRRIRTEGARPTNLAWGPDGDTRIFVTEQQLGRIEVHDAGTTGLPLYYGTPERMRL